MVELLEPPVERQHPNLLLHCGAHQVAKELVFEVETPKASDTWTPIPHGQLIELVERTLQATNLIIGSVAHSLTHDGARYFGLMEIMSDSESEDYCWVLGLRNSHDKTFPAGVTAGAQVFVCDNLSFSGEVKLMRKHTRFISRDLPLLVGRAIGQLLEKWHDQGVRFGAYKDCEIDDASAHDLVVRAVDVGVCSNRVIPEVLGLWRKPEYDEFKTRNVWSLFNAFTGALREGNLAELPKRTEALHGLLDVRAGIVGRHGAN